MGYNAASGGSPGSSGTKTQARTFAKKNKPTPIKDFITGGGMAGVVIRGVTGSIKTAKTKSKQNTMDYEGQAAGVTPMKNPSFFSGGEVGNNNNSNAVIPLTATTTNAATIAPTTAEVSQSSAVDAAPYDLRKTKKKGKSMTILTSSKGIRSDEELILGKKSLLGIV
tara:strand:- start:40 stop:540 length:501 start_codon:yes stop_codon:yes gene_type:complete